MVRVYMLHIYTYDQYLTSTLAPTNNFKDFYCSDLDFLLFRFCFCFCFLLEILLLDPGWERLREELESVSAGEKEAWKTPLTPRLNTKMDGLVFFWLLLLPSDFVQFSQKSKLQRDWLLCPTNSPKTQKCSVKSKPSQPFTGCKVKKELCESNSFAHFHCKHISAYMLNMIYY